LFIYFAKEIQSQQQSSSFLDG